MTTPNPQVPDLAARIANIERVLTALQRQQPGTAARVPIQPLVFYPLNNGSTAFWPRAAAAAYSTLWDATFEDGGHLLTLEASALVDATATHQHRLRHTGSGEIVWESAAAAGAQNYTLTDLNVTNWTGGPGAQKFEWQSKVTAGAGNVFVLIRAARLTIA
jgi:hypothetical protein